MLLLTCILYGWLALNYSLSELSRKMSLSLALIGMGLLRMMMNKRELFYPTPHAPCWQLKYLS